MNIKEISRRLDALQQVVDRSKPCKIAVTFSDGTTTTTDPIGAWGICRDHMMQGDVVSIKADRPEYAAAADTMIALCRSAQN